MSVQTINQKIELINSYKNAIKNAIKAKGVTVADNEKLENYAAKISLIEQNSGGGGYTIEDMANRNFPAIMNYPGSTAVSYAFNSANIKQAYCENLESLQYCTFQYCKSLTTISMPKVSTTASYCLAACYKLREANLPSAKYIANFAFQSCISISRVILPVCSSIYGYAFSECVNLMHLELRHSSVCKLSNSSAFAYTPIKGYWNSTHASSINGQYGSIYVPMSLVDAYKQSTNWIYYSDRIVGI